MLKPAPGLQHVHDDESDDERERGDDFKIEQRLAADAPELLQVAHRGDAMHDGAEDDRRDDHLHELDEAVAERLQRRLPISGVGKEMPDDDAERDAR